VPDTLRDRVVAALGEAYGIEEEVGRGGMGVVYRATDRKLRRLVAIKVLPPELAYRDDVRQRFLREAQTAAQLNHPNIVPIYAVEEREGLVCFVMALVDGESVAARLQRERHPPVEDVCGVLRGVAEALAYAHSRGIVHRDIKPDNILLDRHTGRAMVTDFGIARAAEGDARLTVTGIAVGTPAYMSPEQAMGEREIDGRADIYSLAIVGYQMLTGELPFTASNTPAMLMKHISDTPRPLRELRNDIPRPLAHAIERAMAKKPADRWSNAIEFRDALTLATLQATGGAVAVAPYQEPRPPAPADDAPRASSAWKHSALRDDGRSGSGREGRRGSTGRQRDAGRRGLPAPRDAIDAANAGWRPRFGGGGGQEAGGAPPIPPWMPPSWRDARRQWRLQQRELNRERLATRGKESLESFAAMPLAERIRRFRRRAASGGISIGVLALINLTFSPQFWWFLFPAGVLSLGLLQRAASLWADGVRFRDVFGARAREVLQADHAEAAFRALPSADDYAARLAPPDVLAGPFGPQVRRAAGDRMAVHEALSKLSKADSQLIPDVAPTVDALAARVGSLAHALHRLEEDVQPTALEDLDARLTTVRAQPESPEREQRLQLLQRQRVTVADLLVRRETLVTQLESATLMLQNMRLDMIALRSAGVQSVLDDVSSATQEARALSRDIAHVLDAAREVR
jgi:serine/threonine protein kinase